MDVIEYTDEHGDEQYAAIVWTKEEFRRARTALGWTLKETAQRTGYSKSMTEFVSRGVRTIPTPMQIIMEMALANAK